MSSTFITPSDWTIEISSDKQAAIWQQSHSDRYLWSRWNAYLNQLCLETIIPWLKAEYLPNATAGIAPSPMPMVWEVVNGSIITVGTKRIALIPTEAIDRSELEVSQEWVDIPSWVADYYLGVQVINNCQELHIYGYATHQQLKTQGDYDPLDRTYCLMIEDLNPDLNSLWLMIDRYTSIQTRATVLPISSLANEQSTTLIERLSNSALIVPRLAVPFSLWAAILEQPELWRQLYQLRHREKSAATVTRLSNWLAGQVDAMWQTLDLELFPQQISPNLRSADPSTKPSDIYRAKTYSLAAEQIALVIGISMIDADESRINVQIQPAGGATQLPGTTQLRLLTATGSEIGQASATVTETIQLQFRAKAGEQFQIEITCADRTWTENFER